MNRNRTPLFVFAASALIVPAATDLCPAQTTSYHIGNSLTWDSQPKGIEALAALRGHHHVAGFHISCGSNLNAIWNNPTATCIDPQMELGRYTEALTGHRFNAVTLQPWRAGDMTLAEDAARVLDFINLTRSNPENADTKFYLYTGWPQIGGLSATWAQSVPDDDSTNSVTAREYFPLLANRVRASTDASVYIIPVGEVFYQLDQKVQAGELPGIDDLSDLYRDSIHASYDIGRYVAGVTTYATLFYENLAGLTAPAGYYASASPLFTPELYDEIHDTVWQVVQQHSLVNAVPEPGTCQLLTCLAVCGCVRWRSRNWRSSLQSPAMNWKDQ